ncbi:class I SAM-dependent methyltransferase [Clostridium sp. D53t1_180928_C8]|uniref:class I SAM-dependent DNA methyltransferase n=1 Tax=Clostridium sp. D53t1_180928_C8 TaxID=2787101 RepID=UPI0018AAB027|nr:class I SAM-dependent methyltransferase [Clostridium sp. D53t1_180928_C8]
MINNTLKFYNKNSKVYIETTLSIDMSNLYNEFLKSIPKDGYILDLGCGSGRDSKAFLDKGYNVTSVDGSKELAKSASKVIGQEVLVSRFEDLSLVDKFDGIWACASLLHVNRKNIVDVIRSISLNLNDNGVFYMSFKYGTDEYIDEKGRYFNCYTEESFNELINLIQGLKVKKIYKTIDIVPGRGDITWLNIICVKGR